MRYKVYLAKLKRSYGSPRIVLKVGITASSDAMRRLTYTGADEPHPISGYFDDLKIMKTIWCENRTEAERVEKKVMDALKGTANNFHNWYEPHHISGITEMRAWDYGEFIRAVMILDEELALAE
jgi:hypothetical protein